MSFAAFAEASFKVCTSFGNANVKIPILLYHDFVTIVPESDPDNFSYINTPQSYEENIKVLLDNGYIFISFQELNDAINGKKC